MPLSVIIPSRLAKNPATDALFLERAVASIETQKRSIDTEIIIGLDAGTDRPIQLLEKKQAIRFAEGGRSQAAALNAAATIARGDLIAFLEDDDQWDPTFLAHALAALEQADFVSSTQLQVDPSGAVISINDYPTPSGWVMKRETWQRVGPFNEATRLHLDNEWLGRLSEIHAKRIHLVEATAPIEPWRMRQVRPWLGHAIDLSGGCVTIRRHDSPWPLVRRTVHDESATGLTAKDKARQEESQREIDELQRRFGRIPW